VSRFNNDPYNLQRFVEAQDPIYALVLTELRTGAKRSHWMWFIFPQLRGLGSSAMAIHYGLASQAETTGGKVGWILAAPVAVIVGVFLLIAVCVILALCIGLWLFSVVME